VTASIAPAPPQQSGGPAGFRTPSSNIYCKFFEGEKEGGDLAKLLRCDVRQMTNAAPPRPSDCDQEWGQAFELAADAKPGERICHNDSVADERLLPLSYGQSWERGGLRCKSEESGVTCINPQGHGFELSRVAQRVF
jgi:hypothetical protein